MRTLLFTALLGVLRVQGQTNDGVIEVTVRDSVTKAAVPGADNVERAVWSGGGGAAKLAVDN